MENHDKAPLETPQSSPQTSGGTEDWAPKFLCASLKSPILLSDGRITTCTLDHNGVNEIANIHDHSFDECMTRYEATRFSAMADPVSKPMCYKCFRSQSRWKTAGVPRSGWMKRSFGDDEISSFKSGFTPQKITMNIELSSKCNLRCIGCGLSEPNFRETRSSANIDMDRLKDWVADGVGHIEQLRLYHMGETWLHPRWAEFAYFVKERRNDISLFTSTNGMPLKSAAQFDDILGTGFDHVMFSIHGASQKSTEMYMGAAFQLDHALNAAKELIERRKRTPGSKLYVSWKYLLFSWNDSRDEIEDALRICDEIGFDEIHFTITSQPSPSKRFSSQSPAWLELRETCAELWPRARKYQSVTPMSAMYPGRNHRQKTDPILFGATTDSVSSVENTSKASGVQSTSKQPSAPVEEALQLENPSSIILNISGKPEPDRQLTDWEKLAKAYFQSQRYAESLEALTRVLEMQHREPSEFQLREMALCLQRLERHAEAKERFEAAIVARDVAGGRAYGEDIYLEMRASLLALGQFESGENLFRLWKETSYLREEKSKVVYCPIPKNACTFFKTALIQNSKNAAAFADSKYDAHQFTRLVNSGYHLGNFDIIKHKNVFSFVVLRDPFKRLVSAYSNLFVRPLNWRNIPDSPAHAAVFDRQLHLGRDLDLSKSISFEEFVHYVAAEPDERLDYHWRPQASFFGSIDDFDMVGCVEDLDPLIHALSKRRWKFDGLEPSNVTNYTSSPFLAKLRRFHTMSPQALHRRPAFPSADHIYTNELRRIVRKRFEEDFSLYEDRFGSVGGNPDSLPLYPTGGALALDARVEAQPAPAGSSDSKAELSVKTSVRTTVLIDNMPGTGHGRAGPKIFSKPSVKTDALVYADANARPDASGSYDDPKGLQRALDEAFERQANGETVRLVLKSGTYRGTFSIAARAAGTAELVIEAESPGTAIISGSEIWDGWVEDGGVWTRKWPYKWALSNVPGSYGDPYLEVPDLMRRREIVFLNGRLCRQVLKKEDLKPCTFWISDDDEAVFIQPDAGDRLADAVIEVGEHQTLLHIKNASHLTIRGLVFQHDTNGFFVPQSGALQLSNAVDTRVENCSFVSNNNKGLQIDGPETRAILLKNLKINDNGCLGMLMSRASSVLMEDCETSYNNWRGAWAGYYRGSPCGMKIMRSQDVTIKGHIALRNRATGVWIDEDNRDVTISGAAILGNYRGLHIEAGPGPVTVSSCTISDNLREPIVNEWQWKFGSGIAITHAQNVTIERCVLSGNDTAQIGIRDDRETRHLKDGFTKTESDEFTASIRWIDNTIAADNYGALVRVPDASYDDGRFWKSFEANGNRYLSPHGSGSFIVTQSSATAARQPSKWSFVEWQRNTSQDGGSSYDDQ